MRVSRFDPTDPAAIVPRLRALAPDIAEVADEVRHMIRSVRQRGDDAVRELTLRFDRTAELPRELRVPPEAIERAIDEVAPEAVEAMRLAMANIEAVAAAQLDAQLSIDLAQGQRVELRSMPVGSAGIYAPGGHGAYPSSVLMCCIPARVAGVDRVAVVSPPDRGGSVKASILAAAAICGVDEVYAMGGAQAIGALAYGTESVRPVDVIAGPGNRFVQEAKRQVFGQVGVDAVAGPSELMAIIDGSANLEWAALDLCAQAEHGADSPLVVAAADPSLLDDLQARVERIADERPSVTDASLALVEAADLDAALELANDFAPEHLQLMCEGAVEMAARVRTAGCVFTGNEGGTAFGDYAAGSNHVLPTGGSGRFSGPLGPGAFRRRMSVVTLPAAAAGDLAPHIGVLARTEGFPVHGESAEARLRT
jgi:histidinol dehydrogenase